jgi:predicted ArsR family transcriptional regulator
MDQASVYTLNRKAILRVLRAHLGVKARKVAAKTGLCLRTVQSHLRDLREEGLAHNCIGHWFDGPATSKEPS